MAKSRQVGRARPADRNAALKAAQAKADAQRAEAAQTEADRAASQVMAATMIQTVEGATSEAVSAAVAAAVEGTTSLGDKIAEGVNPLQALRDRVAEAQAMQPGYPGGIKAAQDAAKAKREAEARFEAALAAKTAEAKKEAAAAPATPMRRGGRTPPMALPAERLVEIQKRVRDKLSPMQEAHLYTAILKETGWSRAEMARQVCLKEKYRRWWDQIIYRTSLLDLSEEQQQLVDAGDISEMHAWDLCKLPSAKRQELVDQLMADKKKAAERATVANAAAGAQPAA